jgi:hypothetical protein
MTLVRDSIRKAKENFKSFEEIRLFVSIFLFLSIIPFLIKVLSIPRLMTLITPKETKTYKKLNTEGLMERVVKYTDFILGLNFLIYKPKCLKRSIILYHYLRQAGISVYICFGVRLNDRNTDMLSTERLEGHAWLLHDGQIFLEKDIEMTKTYKMTFRFPTNNDESLNQVGNRS